MSGHPSTRRGSNARANRPVVFVPDDARVIRTSELQRLYEIAGDQRTVAEALGVSVSTVCRALGGGESRSARAAREERLRAVREALGDV